MITAMGSRRRIRIGVVAGMVAISLLTASCGDDTATTTEPGDSSTTAAPTSTETSTTTAPSTASTSSTSTSSTTTTAPPPSTTADDGLPGTAFDRAPGEGRVLAVIGVEFDDVLNVRAAPGVDQAIVAELDPLAADFEATGRARMLTSSIWWEVITAEGVTGWVSSSFTAQIGPTGDLTSQVVAAVGAIPEAETMIDLALVVVDALADEPDFPMSVVLTVEPSVGDLGEVTYDMVGLGDDAVRGLRVHVFGQPVDGDGFSLKSVEATDMCDPTRGPSEPGGLCA